MPDTYPGHTRSTPVPTSSYSGRTDLSNEAHEDIPHRGQPGSSQDRDTSTSGRGLSQTCLGCLYFSRRLQEGKRNPICVGLKNLDAEVKDKATEQAGSTSKEQARALSDFKYACLGLSLYKDSTHGDLDNGSTTPTSSSDLPICVGIEMLADRRLKEVQESGAGNTSRSENDIGKGARGPQPPGEEASRGAEGQAEEKVPPSFSPLRPLGGLGRLASDEFVAKFAKSAGLIAARCAANIQRAASDIKAGIDEVIHPDRDRGRSK